MSATSPAIDDSNTERDYEYADDEFLTESEIFFSSSTESEPQRGQEAKARFTFGAEASTSAQSDDDLFDKGLLCPHSHFFSGVVSLGSTRSSVVGTTSLPTWYFLE